MTPRAIAIELARSFPLSWELNRAYALPSATLGEPYYIKWDGGSKPRGEGWEDDGTFDDDGVFIMGSFRNPVHVAQVALTIYERAYAGDPHARASFLAQADWLVRAQESDGSYRYPVAEALYSAPPGWISGMAQGEAASVLLRAYAITGEQHYLAAGERALRPLFSSVADGGSSYMSGGDLFFEEAAVQPECHILNGHLYAAFAVWEYARHVRPSDYEPLHRDAVATLERWLPAFDVGGWSCYDLAIDDAGRRHLAPLWYHHFHIAQLRVYESMTQRPSFGAMAQRWNAALSRNDVRARVWAYNAHTVARGIARRLRRGPVRALQPLPPFTAEPART